MKHFKRFYEMFVLIFHKIFWEHSFSKLFSKNKFFQKNFAQDFFVENAFSQHRLAKKISKKNSPLISFLKNAQKQFFT